MSKFPRFRLWSFYAAVTFILSISIGQVDVNAVQNIDDIHGKKDKAWGLAISIISLLTVLFVLGAHLSPLLRSKIIDHKAEGIIIGILLCMSIAIVAIVSGPERGLAVDKDGAVFIGNMYYFAWIGLFNVVSILSSFLESAYGLDVAYSMRSKSSSFTYWSGLLAASIIVMSTSADIYNRNCLVANEEKRQPFCSRSVIAVTIGTLGTLFSLAILTMKISLGAAPFLVEIGLGFLLFILYIVEIAHVTDVEGPGEPLGNLYYFSWISFLLTLGVGKACHEDYVEAQIIMDQQRNSPDRPMPTLRTVELSNGPGAVDDVDI